jgi:DUF1680 family protein
MTSASGQSAGPVKPVLEAPEQALYDIHGTLGQRIRANVQNWLLTVPAANPAMLQMFRDRDRLPARDLVPWAGEFAGKYLISAVQALRLTGGRPLRETLERFVADLIATQSPEGYLGPFPTSEGMMGPGRWDLWGQYHVMLGLLLWFRETGDASALLACRRAADLLCRTFLDGKRRVVQAGSEEMNESCIHIFALLHAQTGEPRYLQMAREIEKDWETPPSGDHIRAALAGKPFYQHPKPRWESLHGIQAIAELFFLTGEVRYRQAFEAIWWSIVEGDRHNTGGFSSGEQATGNPYDTGAIETCCTIAWMAVTQDYLRMTGEVRAADELELSLWNAVLGAQNAAGRWWTYNTPMDGERKASAHDIVFQARAGSPELNCCSVNGPRGLGILSEWAVMTRQDGIALNFYGHCKNAVRTPEGTRISLEQRTDYPVGGHVEIVVRPESDRRFVLYLRIPGWTRQAAVRVNGVEVQSALPGSYLELDRLWSSGDSVDLDLDMSPRLWVGEREAAGKVSLYHGPLLLAYDTRFGPYDTQHLPVVDLTRAPHLLDAQQTQTPAPSPLLLIEFATEDGGLLRLCDFASAGAAGNPYASWLPAARQNPAPFHHVNPLRAQWPAFTRH